MPGVDGILLEKSLEPGNIFLQLYLHRLPKQLLRDIEEVGCGGLNGYVDPCRAADVLESVGCTGMNRSAQGLVTVLFVRLEFCDLKRA